MATQKPKSARAIAIAVLNRFDPKRNAARHAVHYAGEILNKLIEQTNEKQRATDLVFGTIRNRTAIDMAIAEFANCSAKRIPDKLLNIIRIGAYELIYCPATGEYAIVNEAVENANTIAGKKQAGFVNAVLRQIARHINSRTKSLTYCDAQKTLPQTIEAGCEFDVGFLPEPKKSPADYFSKAFSLPKWLIDDWLNEFGFEKLKQICFASNRKPGIYIRPNTLKTTTKDLAEKFRQADIDFEILAGQSMLKVKSPKAVVALAGFAEGLFSVQDITACQAVRNLNPPRGGTILDLCAAPGTKTTQLAEETGDKAKIVATDIDGSRLEKVKENIARLGIKSVSVIAYEDSEKVVAGLGGFDCVLLDVPCSNTGVLAKRIEVRLRLKPKAIKQLAEIQSRLLETAAEMLRLNGKICYSTCSIQRNENCGLIEEFLKNNRNFKLEYEKLTLPAVQGFDHDGGYVALISKSEKCKTKT